MRKPTAIALAVLAAASAGLYGLGPGLSGASSHREAPMISFDPAADNAFGNTFPFLALPNASRPTAASAQQPEQGQQGPDPNASPSVAPASSSSMLEGGMMWAGAHAGAALAGGLGLAFFLGWWVRYRRRSEV